MLSYNILNRLDERKTDGAHKASFLFEFNLENYQKEKCRAFVYLNTHC
ncbi:MAG: hypothetical protein Q8P34_17645 [Bacteroidota bacterium]|nr:hypothetical protein [Bacteroidota bacterium]